MRPLSRSSEARHSMSVRQSLYRYLTDNRALPGHPAQRFASDRVVGELKLKTRNDARQALRDKVGREIYADRIRQKSAAHTAIELRTVSSEAEYALKGEHDISRELLLINVYARGSDAAQRATNTAALVRLAISGYAGDYWDSTYIGECLIESESTQSFAPGDASDDWTHLMTLDASVSYRNTRAALYPQDMLQAVVRVTKTGTQLRLDSTRSIVSEGRPLTTAQWVLRDGGPTGASVLVISGNADSAATTANVSGTNANPVVNLSLVTLPTTYNVALTLTDENGTSSTAEVLFNG